MTYHKDFPWQKGLWVWDLKKCLGGNLDSIIQKCHGYDISYLLIKTGDGGNLWSQLSRDSVSKFQSAGIKVYSWTFNYGTDPMTEAAVAIKSLDLGVNGHVFNAEGAYENLANNHQAAETMLQAVRARHPDKFLAHAPFAIINVHPRFPYATFGKYCDAVMPQVYWGTMGRTPQDATTRTYNAFKTWEDNLRATGHADCVKPIIPIGQSYDNYTTTPPFVLTPADIHSFINLVKGYHYKSVNFWSFQHLLRDDCWNALRDAKVDPPTDEDRGIVVAHEEPKPVVTEPTPTPESPATVKNGGTCPQITDLKCPPFTTPRVR